MTSRSLVILPFARKALSLNTPAVTTVPGRLASDHHGPPANYKFPTMDEMLVPCGSWQEDYNNKQRKYNIHLLFGSGFFIVTFLIGIYSGHLKGYATLPARPAPRIEGAEM